jgi:hypothetical protein
MPQSIPLTEDILPGAWSPRMEFRVSDMLVESASNEWGKLEFADQPQYLDIQNL